MDNGDTTPGAEFKPGDTITPGSAAAEAAPQAAASAPQPLTAAAAEPAQPEPATAEVASAPAPAEPVEPPASFAFNPEPDDDFAPVAPQVPVAAQPVRWTASEFVAHHKSAGWYLILAAIAIVLAGGVWLLFHDLFSSIVVLIVAAMFGFYAARDPRELTYALDDHGLTIGPKFRPYQEFRSFSITQEGSTPSIAFMPLKRFGMVATIYFAPEIADAVVTILSLHLPMAEHKNDAIDALMHRVRF